MKGLSFSHDSKLKQQISQSKHNGFLIAALGLCGPPRHIVLLESLASRVSQEFRDWDEISSGLQFVIARHPEIFHKLGNSRIRVAVLECYRNVPEVHVIFAYDEERVYSLDAYLGESGEAGK